MSVEAKLQDDVITKYTGANDALLSIQDLHVWFELRRFGFGHNYFN